MDLHLKRGDPGLHVVRLSHGRQRTRKGRTVWLGFADVPISGCVALVPGTDPVAALARTLATAGIRAGRPWSLVDVRGTLDRHEGAGLGSLLDELLATSPEARRVALPLDQAEELFTRADAAGMERFTRLLTTATAGPVRVVATLRSEFLDDLRTLPQLAEVGIGSFLLAPLGHDMLRLAIEQPARRAGFVLPAELSARLVADTGGGEALPLLAFTLHQLAVGHGRGDTLSDRDYERLGGVSGALGRQADAALTAASVASGLSGPQILARLVNLATIDDVGRYSRRRLPRDPTDTTWDAALAVFVDHRLLTIQAAWHDHPEYGRRLIVYAYDEQHRLLKVVLQPIDSADGSWRLRTAVVATREGA
jgi:Novel STAND NTPase 1